MLHETIVDYYVKNVFLFCLRFTVYGLRFMVYGLQFTVYSWNDCRRVSSASV